MEGNGAAAAREQVLTVQFEDRSRGIHDGLSRYFNKRLFSDLTVVAPDGARIHAHQLVLSAGSRRFATMLETGTLQGSELPVRGVDSQGLFQVIRFFYTGDCDVTYRSVLLVYDAAHRLDVPRLAKECEKFSHKVLEPRTASCLLQHALRFSMSDFAARCGQVIRCSFDEVTAGEDFLCVDVNTLMRVLTDNAPCQNEGSIFRAAWRWGMASLGRMQLMPEVFKAVKVPNLSMTDLLKLAGPLPEPVSVHAGGLPGEQDTPAATVKSAQRFLVEHMLQGMDLVNAVRLTIQQHFRSSGVDQEPSVSARNTNCLQLGTSGVGARDVPPRASAGGTTADMTGPPVAASRPHNIVASLPSRPAPPTAAGWNGQAQQREPAEVASSCAASGGNEHGAMRQQQHQHRAAGVHPGRIAHDEPHGAMPVEDRTHQGTVGQAITISSSSGGSHDAGASGAAAVSSPCGQKHAFDRQQFLQTLLGGVDAAMLRSVDGSTPVIQMIVMPPSAFHPGATRRTSGSSRAAARFGEGDKQTLDAREQAQRTSRRAPRQRKRGRLGETGDDAEDERTEMLGAPRVGSPVPARAASRPRCEHRSSAEAAATARPSPEVGSAVGAAIVAGPAAALESGSRSSSASGGVGPVARHGPGQGRVLHQLPGAARALGARQQQERPPEKEHAINGGHGSAPGRDSMPPPSQHGRPQPHAQEQDQQSHPTSAGSMSMHQAAQQSGRADGANGQRHLAPSAQAWQMCGPSGEPTSLAAGVAERSRAMADMHGDQRSQPIQHAVPRQQQQVQQQLVQINGRLSQHTGQAVAGALLGAQAVGARAVHGSQQGLRETVGQQSPQAGQNQLQQHHQRGPSSGAGQQQQQPSLQLSQQRLGPGASPIEVPGGNAAPAHDAPFELVVSVGAPLPVAMPTDILSSGISRPACGGVDLSCQPCSQRGSPDPSRPHMSGLSDTSSLAQRGQPAARWPQRHALDDISHSSGATVHPSGGSVPKVMPSGNSQYPQASYKSQPQHPFYGSGSGKVQPQPGNWSYGQTCAAGPVQSPPACDPYRHVSPGESAVVDALGRALPASCQPSSQPGFQYQAYVAGATVSGGTSASNRHRNVSGVEEVQNQQSGTQLCGSPRDREVPVSAATLTERCGAPQPQFRPPPPLYTSEQQGLVYKSYGTTGAAIFAAALPKQNDDGPSTAGASTCDANPSPRSQQQLAQHGQPDHRGPWPPQQGAPRQQHPLFAGGPQACLAGPERGLSGSMFGAHAGNENHVRLQQQAQAQESNSHRLQEGGMHNGAGAAALSAGAAPTGLGRGDQALFSTPARQRKEHPPQQQQQERQATIEGAAPGVVVCAPIAHSAAQQQEQIDRCVDAVGMPVSGHAAGSTFDNKLGKDSSTRLSLGGDCSIGDVPLEALVTPGSHGGFSSGLPGTSGLISPNTELLQMLGHVPGTEDTMLPMLDILEDSDFGDTANTMQRQRC